MKKKKRIKELEKTVNNQLTQLFYLGKELGRLENELNRNKMDCMDYKEKQGVLIKRVEQLGKLVSYCLKEGENEREKFTEESPGVLE